MIKNNQLYVYNVEPKKNKIYKYYQNEKSDSFTIGPYKGEDNISYFSLDTDFEKYLGEFVKYYFKITSETKDKKEAFRIIKNYFQIDRIKGVIYNIKELHDQFYSLIYNVIGDLNESQLDLFVKNTKKHIKLLYDLCNNKLNKLQSIDISQYIKKNLQHLKLEELINVSNCMNTYFFENICCSQDIYDKQYLKYFNELNNNDYPDDMYKIIISEDQNDEMDDEDKEDILKNLNKFNNILTKYIVLVCLNQLELNYDNYDNTNIINMKINNDKLNDNLKLIIPSFIFFKKWTMESYSVYTRYFSIDTEFKDYLKWTIQISIDESNKMRYYNTFYNLDLASESMENSPYFYLNLFLNFDFKEPVSLLEIDNDKEAKGISQLNIDYISEIGKICKSTIDILKIKLNEYSSKNSLIEENYSKIIKYNKNMNENNIINKFLLEVFNDKKITENNNKNYLKYFGSLKELNEKYEKKIKDILKDNDFVEDLHIKKYLNLLCKYIIISYLLNFDFNYKLEKMNVIKDRGISSIFIIPNIYRKNGRLVLPGLKIN